MMNNYRVDRTNNLYVPAGMNSIVYIGDNLRKAQQAFDRADTRINEWSAPDDTYGVVLSYWNGSDYIIKKHKGLI